MRILIVEDEVKTLAYLKKGLTEAGFGVDTAKQGDEGLLLATSKEYALLILDVMLPGMDGWCLLSELRKKGNQTPALFLTARDSVDDKVKGLKLGADDYLIKPFAFSELLARIQTILRRGQNRPLETLQIADLEIDFLKHKVARAGKKIELTSKEFLLLSYMARRSGDALSRTVLAEQVWDMNFDSDTNVVDVAVRRLRAKLDDPFDKPLIHSIYGVGYVFEAR